MSDVIVLKGSNTEGTFKELKAQYLRGKISLVEDKQSLYSAAAMYPDNHLARLLWYDYHFDRYMDELAKGAFSEKPSIIKDLKVVAMAKGEACVERVNLAIAACEEAFKETE